MNQPAIPLKPLSGALMGALFLLFGAQTASAAPDWSKVPKRDVIVAHVGVVPIEWIKKKSDHSGTTGLRKGETCVGCHEEKGSLNFDMARIGKDLEPKGMPKTTNFPVSVQAAYDKDQLYLRLSFKAPAETSGEKLDKDNEMKVSVMFAGDKEPLAAQVGCWETCHADARTMPGADDKKTKHVDNANLDGGIFYDLIQWRSGGGAAGAKVDGHVADTRVMEGGTALQAATGEKKGDTWTITFTRKLTGGKGDVALAEGKVVPIGIAVHNGYTGGRFHYVSLGYKLGIGADGDIKATKQ